MNAVTQPLAPGMYTLFLTVDDGFNPVATSAMAGPFVVVNGRAGVSPTRSTAYGVQGSRIVMTVGESENGPPVSLNGDLDTSDGVLGTLNSLTGAFTQHARSIDVTGIDGQGTARRIDFLGPYAFATTRELDEGVSLNGDADISDLMTSAYESSTPAVVTHLYGGMTSSGLVSGSKALCRVIEAQEGNGGTDLNGDGDKLDTEIAVLDAPTNLHVVIPQATSAAAPLRLDGTFFAYQVSEANQGAILNGDADATDTLLALGEITQPVPFRGFAGFIAPAVQPRAVQPGAAFAVSAARLLGYYVDEVTTGVDVNGDGDQLDRVPAIWSNPILPPNVESIPGLAAFLRLDAGNNPRHAFFEGGKFVYTAVENPGYSPGAGDNGDGDLADTEILRWTDTATPGVTNVLNPALGPPFAGLTGLALDGGSLTEVAPGWLAAVVNETANGNLDLSGDGVLSTALLLIDFTAAVPVVWNTGLSTAASGRIPATGIGSATGVVVSAPESVNGILNGDGDALDTVCLFVPFATPNVPVELSSTGAIDALVVGTRIGLTAYEALTTTDHNLDGDATDHVFRIVSTAGVVEVGGLTCAPTSRPASDTGLLWAYLRSEAAEARDLNGDLDQFDVVVGAWKP